MPGFISHYLFGIEGCDLLPDDYIKQVIDKNRHPFLIGLQGEELLPVNIHALSRQGLSYRTAARHARNQEYGAIFNHMLEYISTLSGSSRDACISFMSGFLCYYIIEQTIAPYVSYRVYEWMPLNPSARRKVMTRMEVESVIDTMLLRSHCHMEPSQLNFEALTFAGKKDLDAIGKMMQSAILATYHRKISPSEISSSLKNMRRQIINMEPTRFLPLIVLRQLRSGFSRGNLRIYTDFITDDQDHMNEKHNIWFPFPGWAHPLTASVEELYDLALHSSRHFLEDLDSCLSWGMDNDSLIRDVFRFEPFNNL